MEVVITDAKAIAEIGADDRRRNQYQRLKSAPLMIIDELGEEPPEVVVYGRVLTPVRDLLEERYRRQQITIVATNLVTRLIIPSSRSITASVLSTVFAR